MGSLATAVTTPQPRQTSLEDRVDETRRPPCLREPGPDALEGHEIPDSGRAGRSVQARRSWRGPFFGGASWLRPTRRAGKGQRLQLCAIARSAG